MRWWAPDHWVFVDELPKTTVGKYDKKVLRARYAAGDLGLLEARPERRDLVAGSGPVSGAR